MIYKEQYRLVTGNFDSYDRIRPDSIFDYFQVGAGAHAVNLQLGYDDLLQQNKIWVLLRSKFIIIKYPKVNDLIKVITWPLPKQRIEYERQYQIVDENDEILIKGTSIWCLVDTNTRMISRFPLLYPGDFYNEDNFSEPYDKLPTFDLSEFVFSYQHQVRFSDLDHNRHMNNARYSELIINSLDLSDEKVISEVDINFINETKQGDMIRVYKKKNNNHYFLIGFKDDLITFKAFVRINHQPK